jgi:hypothetical protein
MCSCWGSCCTHHQKIEWLKEVKTKMDAFTKLVIFVFAVSILSLVIIADTAVKNLDVIPDAKTEAVISKNSIDYTVTLADGTNCLCTPEIYNTLEVNSTYHFQGTFNWYTKDFTITHVTLF